MNRVIMFATGLAVGVAMQYTFAQQARIRGLNHVAISVDDYAGATDFYGRKLGFREAFSFRQPDGTPYFTYFQVNRDTFVEVMQATPARPAGCPHFGLEVENLDSVIGQLKQRGVQVGASSVSPRTRSRSALATGPGGVNIELFEFGPESLHRRVMDAWK
jgi:catechol 2,3-dioxygenase-like lactoylglutathione lyase family enzyme